jgi:hypothetical protein
MTVARVLAWRMVTLSQGIFVTFAEAAPQWPQRARLPRLATRDDARVIVRWVPGHAEIKAAGAADTEAESSAKTAAEPVGKLAGGPSGELSVNLAAKSSPRSLALSSPAGVAAS